MADDPNDVPTERLDRAVEHLKTFLPPKLQVWKLFESTQSRGDLLALLSSCKNMDNATTLVSRAPDYSSFVCLLLLTFVVFE
jgi:hypothetical protein